MLELLPPLLPDLTALYRELHAHPELSFAEHRTAAEVARRLTDLGYEVTTGIGRTGVVGVLRNGDGPTVLLRADMDALPVTERTGLPYASRFDGVMHACGHDLHVTWLLGAAAVFATARADWSGTLMLVFQPAEEVAAGADAMVDDGVFDRFGVPDVGLGQHVFPLPAGTIRYCGGPAMAAADALRIRLIGRGAHGSTPEAGVDPVVLAAATVLRLQTVVSRELGLDESAVLTIGTLHAGTKENVIPDDAELTVNIRSFDDAVRTRVLAAVERIANGEAAVAGAPRPPEIETMYRFPVLHNDEAVTARVAEAFVERFGADAVRAGRRVAGSEDFGVFGDRGGFPSLYWFVGGSDPDSDPAGRPSNHSPLFAPVLDPTLGHGVEALVTAAGLWLAR